MIHSRRRRGRAGIVTRKVVEDKTTIDVETGKSTIIRDICIGCRTTKPRTEFYLESKSRAKYKDDVRSLCIECWDKCKGAISKLDRIG